MYKRVHGVPRVPSDPLSCHPSDLRPLSALFWATATWGLYKLVSLMVSDAGAHDLHILSHVSSPQCYGLGLLHSSFPLHQAVIRTHSSPCGVSCGADDFSDLITEPGKLADSPGNWGAGSSPT